MGYIKKNKVLEYIDVRIKQAPRGEAEELKTLASMIISAPNEKVREDDRADVCTSRVNGKVALCYCYTCRNILKNGDVFCSKCGRRLNWPQEELT